jgi:hypothetical protein
MSPKPRHSIAALAALVIAMWAAPAHASVITVDWDVVPHDDQELAFDDSPYYQCSGVSYSTRLCQSLWDTGLALDATSFSFYDDKFVDGYGVGEDEANIGPGLPGGQRISPECKSGLSPCFDSFTPDTLRIVGLSSLGPDPNIFVLSSKGGLVKLPSLFGLASISLSGSEWTDLSWLEIGFYIAGDCEDAECETATEKAFWVEDLSFEGHSVPEPSLIVLIGAGIGAVGRRRYQARTATTADGSHTHTSSF